MERYKVKYMIDIDMNQKKKIEYIKYHFFIKN